jgi:acyl transferase domain-containing protein/acyl carrier protein
MNGEEIAVVGISCRFPGADNVETFWDNLVQGKESVVFLTPEEIENIADKKLTGHPDFVPCKGGVLNNRDHFDAPFFGYSPREAALMDPQMRIFHECVWSALEDAGYTPGLFKGLIGLYAGASDNIHWKNHVLLSPEARLRDGFTITQLIDKDFICSRIAYNLNLTGPCYAVQTACSTSLIAVHLACQAILNGECDLAVAGGISVNYGMENGYLYQEGAVLSPDGHCRAFDAQAAGTVPGSGAGVVVLKLLEKAIRDKDPVYAVIKGSAINNDGRQKAGYTAPGVNGQAQVIKTALAIAETDPSSIHYIEAHGTGTALGDPVEIEALTEVFGKHERPFCGIGSLKSNLGHLDVAAGVAGLIKTVLALKNRQLPPTLHFAQPNRNIDFHRSPFYVVNGLKDLHAHTGVLKAGVSSFGIGGTNAHVILEEFSESDDNSRVPETHQLILLSAKTTTALHKAGKKLNRHLSRQTGDRLADIAYTLATARERFMKRRAIVTESREDLMQKLEAANLDEVIAADPGEIIFMFSGQGAQYMNMAAEIYKHEPLFRGHLDAGFDAYRKITGQHIKPLIFPDHQPEIAMSDSLLHQTQYTQPALFIFEYAMARLLTDLGIRPHNMIGHSIGEYVAACMAGVFSFEEGLRIVIKRGELMQSMPTGAMLSVAATEQELQAIINGDVSIAAINAPGHYVISGETEKIKAIGIELKAKGYHSTLLKTSHGFHSAMMNAAMTEFRQFLQDFRLQPPASPFISNLSGETITAEQATDPQYWADHLRYTVNFSKGIGCLLSRYPAGIFIELGPGHTLSSFTKKNALTPNTHRVIHLIKPAAGSENDHAGFLRSLGSLWEQGINIDWGRLYTGRSCKRVHLPTYAFDEHVFNASPAWQSLNELLNAQQMRSNSNTSASIYHVPFWEQLIEAGPVIQSQKYNWLVFINETLPAENIIRQLEAQAATIVFVREGDGFCEHSSQEFIINPAVKEDYFRLMELLKSRSLMPDKIIHTWSCLHEHDTALSFERLEKYKQIGFYSLIYLAQSFGALGITTQTSIAVIANQSVNVFGNDLRYPEKSLLMGLSKIIPVEYPHIRCRYIDILPEDLSADPDQLVTRVLAAISSTSGHPLIALRGNHSWVQNYRHIDLPHPLPENSLFKQNSVYLITGGLGGMALYIARMLTLTYKATVILVSRSRPDSLDRTVVQNQIKLQLIEDILNAGGQIVIRQADIGDQEAMHEVVTSCEQQYGPISGILHTAATIDEAGAIQKRKRADFENSLHAKVNGAVVLYQLFKNRPLDFVLLFSSLGTVTYGNKYGEAGYVAANDFLDALAHYPFGNQHTVVKTINWCDWAQVGISIRSIDKFYDQDAVAKAAALTEFEKDALSPEEGVAAFSDIMAVPVSRIVISRASLKDLNPNNNDGWKKKLDLFRKQQQHQPRSLTERPEQAEIYTAPANELQKKIVAIWQQYFGYEEIGIHDNIFEMGANSLDLAQINEAFKSILQIEIPLVTLFEYPTIDKLAKYIQGNVTADTRNETDSRIDEGKHKMNKIRAQANR